MVREHALHCQAAAYVEPSKIGSRPEFGFNNSMTSNVGSGSCADVAVVADEEEAEEDEAEAVVWATAGRGGLGL
jgi:hypothetical protein